jgi:hypothetical protein
LLELSLWTRVEHEYKRQGALQCLAAWDVHRAASSAACTRLASLPLALSSTRSWPPQPYRSAKRVFWIVDNGSSHRGLAAVEREQARHPNLGLIHCPIHSSRLNQVEIYLSIVDRKVLTSNDFPDPAEVERRLIDFERRYEQVAQPFEWKFTRQDLANLLRWLKVRSDAA